VASGDVPASLNWELTKTDERSPETVRFARIYEDSLRHVYSFIRAQVEQAHVAEELVGRVYLKAYKHRSKFPESDEEALFWILRVARTTLIDYFRVEGRRDAVNVPLDEVAIPPQFNQDPESLLLERQRRRVLIRLMNEFDTEIREVLVLKFFAQRTNREIAAILEISEGAVSMRLLRALRSLRSRLTHAGW
jgi:RNA polymerase sigma-70 factor, ECF subfamily